MKQKSVKRQLTSVYLSLFIVLMLLSFSSIYYGVKQLILADIQSSLDNSSYLINEMIETAADASIKNHLRTTSETHLELTKYYYDTYKEGKLSEEDAKSKCLEHMAVSKVGRTGYVYVINSQGVLVAHPFDEMVGVDISEWSFVKSQISLKDGYIEYDWKNPDEVNLREKALYMVYFKPWDWIISVSSYREEFLELVNVKDFETQVLGLRFGQDGYPIVLDYEGTFLIHPLQKGRNVIKEASVQAPVIEKFIHQKTGILEYPWKNPNEDTFRDKITVLSDLPEYEWIIASTAYKEEFYKPLEDLLWLMGIVFFLLLLIAVIMTTRMSLIFSKPIVNLQKTVLQGAKGDLSIRVNLDGDREDEVTKLGRYFNQFMTVIESQSLELKKWNDDLEQLIEDRTTELSEANRRLNHAEKIESLNELIKIIAHNMNTPLGNALMSATFLNNQITELELLVNEGIEQEREMRKILNKLQTASIGIEKNINKSTELIDMFKIFTKSDELRIKEKIILKELVVESVEKSGYSMDQVKIICDENLMIEESRDLLQMIVSNLMTNAFEHAYSDMALGDIRIEIQGRVDAIQLSVIDYGIGMNEDEVKKVFEPFYSKNNNMAISGLGLSVVYNTVVNVLSGEVSLQSEEGRGTIVHVIIPYKK